MSIIDYPTEITTLREKFAIYVDTESGPPQFAIDAEMLEWYCANYSVSPYGFDGEQTTVTTPIPDEVAGNTSIVWNYEPLGLFYTTTPPPQPSFVEAFPASETYPGSGVWIHTEYWLITRITNAVRRYEKTPRPEVGVATIIPLVAVLAIGALGVLLANNSGGGRIESR